MAVYQRWTIRQVKRLERLYPNYPRIVIEQELTPHSWKAIRGKAAAQGIARRLTHRDWMAIVRQHRPTFMFTPPPEGDRPLCRNLFLR